MPEKTCVQEYSAVLGALSKSQEGFDGNEMDFKPSNPNSALVTVDIVGNVASAGVDPCVSGCCVTGLLLPWSGDSGRGKVRYGFCCPVASFEAEPLHSCAKARDSG